MIEVESRCNFNCPFCFNKLSFAKNGRNLKPLSKDYIKKIINSIAKLDIKIVRFTGGEPMLRADILELFKYAKSKKLQVWLNSNCSLVNKKISLQMEGLVDNVLIPIESDNIEKEDKMTGHKNSLYKKIKGIKYLKDIKIPILRCGTVATKENIYNFENLYNFIVKELKFKYWEWYRPVETNSDLEEKDFGYLIKKISKHQDIKNSTTIANALPFCFDKNHALNSKICSGALREDGHSRIVVDPRGFLKPHYFDNKNIGDPLKILEAWNSPFMKKTRELKYLPKECKECKYKKKCRGGSKYLAAHKNNSLFSLDPLAHPSNIK